MRGWGRSTGREGTESAGNVEIDDHERRSSLAERENEDRETITSSSMHVVRERAIVRRVETYSARIPGHAVVVSAVWHKRSRRRKEIGNVSFSSAIAGCWSTKLRTERRSSRPKKGDRRDTGARSGASPSSGCYPNWKLGLTGRTSRRDGKTLVDRITRADNRADMSVKTHEGDERQGNGREAWRSDCGNFGVRAVTDILSGNRRTSIFRGQTRTNRWIARSKRRSRGRGKTRGSLIA